MCQGVSGSGMEGGRSSVPAQKGRQVCQCIPEYTTPCCVKLMYWEIGTGNSNKHLVCWAIAHDSSWFYVISVWNYCQSVAKSQERESILGKHYSMLSINYAMLGHIKYMIKN